MSGKRRLRSRAIKILILYLAVLTAIQAAGIIYFISDPSLVKGIFLAIFLGTILPIILGLIFTRFFKLQ